MHNDININLSKAFISIKNLPKPFSQTCVKKHFLIKTINLFNGCYEQLCLKRYINRLDKNVFLTFQSKLKILV